MRTFGTWLWSSTLDLADFPQLRAAAAQLGQKWPIESVIRSDYEAAIQTSQSADQALKSFRALWPVYEMSENAKKIEEPPKKRPSKWQRVLDAIPGLLVPMLGIGLLVIIYVGFNNGIVDKLGYSDKARGLLTFLFGLTTVGVAIIVVSATYLSTGTSEELGLRFQRGKDVLTVLIGVFGAVLGYYFGSDKGIQTTPEKPSVQSSQPNGADASATPASATPAPTAPAPASAPAATPGHAGGVTVKSSSGIKR
jgi:hypothetical protein